MMIYVLFWTFGYVYSDKCNNNSSNGGTDSWFCCNNHENRNGICTECAIGYVSKDGLPCMRCSYGRYGKKCGNICSCQHNKRCDIVHGCIEGTTAIPGSVEKGKCYKNASNGVKTSWYCCDNHEEKNGRCQECKIGYVSKDGIPCTSCSPGQWGKKCIHPCICQHNKRCDHVHGCVYRKIITSESMESTEMTTPKTVPKAETKDGFLLIVYTFGTGSIAALVALASCCFKYKRKLDQSNTARSSKMPNNKAATAWKDVCRNNERDNYFFNGNIMIDNSKLMDIETNNVRVNTVKKPANEDLFQSMIEVDIHRTLPEDTTQDCEKMSPEHSGPIKHSVVPIYGNIHTDIPMISYCDENEYTC